MLALLLLILAAATHVSAQDRTVPCEKQLADTLTQFCFSADPLPAEIAKQELKFSEADGKQIDTPDLPDGFTLRARRATNKWIFKVKLLRECCLRSCTVSELLSYC